MSVNIEFDNDAVFILGTCVEHRWNYLPLQM
jgi:hypothetical protein